jgi:hypothetical protein
MHVGGGAAATACGGLLLVPPYPSNPSFLKRKTQKQALHQPTCEEVYSSWPPSVRENVTKANLEINKPCEESKQS